MKSLGLATAVAALALTGAQPAAANQDNKSEGVQELRQGLVRMVQHMHQPPGQSSRPDDPDQGDDNASDRAIFVVCTRNGPPSSERSAICDGTPMTPH